MKRFPVTGKSLRLLRGKRKQTEFAALLGVSLRAYQTYESGARMPKDPVIDRICKVCGITREQFLTGRVPGAEPDPPQTALIDEMAESVKGLWRQIIGSPKDAEIVERLREADDKTKDKIIQLLDRRKKAG